MESSRQGPILALLLEVVLALALVIVRVQGRALAAILLLLLLARSELLFFAFATHERCARCAPGRKCERERDREKGRAAGGVGLHRWPQRKRRPSWPKNFENSSPDHEVPTW